MKTQTKRTTLKTYGKISLYDKVSISLKERFKPNRHRETSLKTYGLKSYIPKLNKTRFIMGILGVAVFIVIPFITPLAIVPLLWGIKWTL